MMQLCEPHRHKLLDEVVDYGIVFVIDRTSDEVLEAIDSGDISDPLLDAYRDIVLGANQEIITNAILRLGARNDTTCCPICESEAKGGPLAEWWLQNAVREQYAKVQFPGVDKSAFLKPSSDWV